MRLLLCLSIVLLQALLSSSSIPPEWIGTMDNNIPQPRNRTSLGKIECNDDDCKEMELLMKSSIKQSVKPCDDFYTHACGQWINRHPLGGRSIIDQYTTIKEDLYKDLRGYLTESGDKYRSDSTNSKARNFYESCMNEKSWRSKSLDGLKQMVRSNGPWLLTKDNQTTENTLKWQDVHRNYYEKYDLPALFHFQVLPNKRNSTKHIITLSIPFVDIHESSTATASKTPLNSNTAKTAYRSLIRKIAKTVSRGKTVRKVRRLNRQKVDSVIAFEKNLRQLTKSYDSPLINYHHDSSYMVITIDAIQDSWDMVLQNMANETSLEYKMNWLETIRDTFRKAKVTIPIYGDNEIAIEPGHYIKFLIDLLKKTETETIVNYIHWNAVKSMLKYSGNRINSIVNHYNKIVYGAESEDPRWLQCVRDFPLEYFLTARMGRSQHLRMQQKYITPMLYSIEGAFMDSIKTSKSLPADRKAFRRKFSPDMHHWVGFSDWSRNIHWVIDYYKKLRVERDNYFNNIVSFNKFMRHKELMKLGMPVDRLTAEWPVSPMDFVAAYDPHTNTIVLPAGLLRHPYMKFYKIPAIQYGSLGMIIGHEMAHSIDSKEHASNGLKNMDISWTLQVSSLYKTVEKCYRNEYSGYNIELGTGERLPIDSNLAIREIIADNMGIRMAYQGLQDWHVNKAEVGLPESNFTNDQAFFYSFAQSFCENASDEYLRNVYEIDEHPPSKVRINGVLSRMKQFHNTFQCKDNDPMKKEVSKCSLFI